MNSFRKTGLAALLGIATAACAGNPAPKPAAEAPESPHKRYSISMRITEGNEPVTSLKGHYKKIEIYHNASLDGPNYLTDGISFVCLTDNPHLVYIGTGFARRGGQAEGTRQFLTMVDTVQKHYMKLISGMVHAHQADFKVDSHLLDNMHDRTITLYMTAGDDYKELPAFRKDENSLELRMYTKDVTSDPVYYSFRSSRFGNLISGKDIEPITAKKENAEAGKAIFSDLLMLYIKMHNFSKESGICD